MKKILFLLMMATVVLGLPGLIPAAEFAGGNGTEDFPFLVETAEHLNNVRNHLDAHYLQTADIDLSGYGSGSGWVAIGSYDRHPFTGSYDGKGYKIVNLFINRSSADHIGLFAYIEDSELKNIFIDNAYVSGNNFVGGLTGYASDESSIINSHVNGKVSGINMNIGGMVGMSKGIITDSSFTGEVTGDLSVGGLLGFNDRGTVTNSHTSGMVSGGGESLSLEAGTSGLVGRNIDMTNSSITDSHSSSTVTGQYYVGGLVGRGGNISNSYATGNVTGTSNLGGLVGINSNIRNSYATGELTGQNRIGGLIGNNLNGTIIESYAYGKVSGAFRVGGLAGYCRGVSITDSYATGEVTGESETGGLIGGKHTTTIIESYASGKVSGTSQVGGLAGWSQHGSITDSYATGNVSGTGGVGGLVGANDVTRISGCYALGDVSGMWGHVGGLIGFNKARITDSFAVGSVSGYEDVGGLIGHNYDGRISGCFAMGAVTGVRTNVGGLIGKIRKAHTIMRVEDSYASGSVSGEENIGGLIGYNTAIIKANFSTGNVSGQATIGGLVGYNDRTIENCYASGSVSGDTDVGGLTGINGHESIIRRSYARGSVSGNNYLGGLVGWNYNLIEESYYDTQTTGQDDTNKGIPRTTEEMKQQDTFVEWDFDEVWNIMEDVTYPYLQWQASPTDSEYEAAIVSSTVPSLYLDSYAEISVTMLNIGLNTWQQESPVKLGAVGDSDALAPQENWRLDLIHDVSPGESHTFTIGVIPQSVGIFITEWQMLREGEFWFGEIFSREVEVFESEPPTSVERLYWNIFE